MTLMPGTMVRWWNGSAMTGSASIGTDGLPSLSWVRFDQRAFCNKYIYNSVLIFDEKFPNIGQIIIKYFCTGFEIRSPPVSMRSSYVSQNVDINER